MNKKFALWNLLFIQYLKRDWKKMMIWLLGLGLFSGAYVPAFEEIGKGQGLLGMYETMQNPAMVAMVGPSPVKKAVHYTVGAMYANEMLLFCGLFAMIISILHVVGHTRKEEDLGLTELIRSFRVGRQANSLAVIVETIVINLLLALVIGGIMASFGSQTITIEGSLLFGASISLAGIIGAVLGLVMAQIMPTSSGATGSSLAIVGTLYILRAGTDNSNIHLSMINPMGWTYLTYPFTENNWFPLILGIVFVLILLLIAFSLEGSRDLNAGYLPEHMGRAYAKKSLLSVPGLFFKINQGMILGWLIAFVCMGVAYGSIYGDMQAFLNSNELMKQMFSHSGTSIEQSFTGTIMMVMIGLAIILPIAVVNKLFAEETRLHLSQLFSTKVSRGQLYWTTVIMAISSGLAGVLLSAGSLGSVALLVMKDPTKMNIWDFLIAGFNYLPTVLFFIGLAGLALGVAPKLGKVVYVYLGYSFSLSYFGGILDLPAWFLKTSALNWPPQMPIEKFNAGVFSVVLITSLVLMILGFIGYKQRDLSEGA